MQTLTLLVLLSGIHCLVYAQDTITGFWHSRDSSRVYAIFKVEKDLKGSLYASKRAGDKIGQTVLNGLKYHKAKNAYEGVIYAVDDGTSTLVKIRMADDKKTLMLKLRRLFFLPVHIKWHKIE